MKTMFNRIKQMDESEMKSFIYWVYLCGNEDGKKMLCDSIGDCSYFGGAMMEMEVTEVMPNNSIDDLWDGFEEYYGK